MDPTLIVSVVLVLVAVVVAIKISRFFAKAAFGLTALALLAAAAWWFLLKE